MSFVCALHAEVVLLLIEATLNHQEHSSFLFPSQLQAFTLVSHFQGKAAEIPTQGDRNQKEIILSNNRWSRIWVFSRKVQELNYVIKHEILPPSVLYSTGLNPKLVPLKVIT